MFVCVCEGEKSALVYGGEYDQEHMHGAAPVVSLAWRRGRGYASVR